MSDSLIETMEPIDYPRFKLRNGAEYRLKFSLGAIKKLKRWEADKEVPPDEDYAWRQLCCQIAAMASVPGDDGELKSAELDPETVMAVQGGADPDMFIMLEMRNAANEALTFRMPPGVKLLGNPTPAAPNETVQ